MPDDWLRQLADVTDGLTVHFKPGLRPDQQRLLGALGVRVVFDENGCDPDRVGAKTDGYRGRRPTGNTVRERILRAMGDGERHGTAELARVVDARYDVVAKELGLMVGQGEIFRLKRGIYRIPRATA